MIIGLCMLGLASCSSARVYVGVVQSVNSYSHGDYQEANRSLIRLRDNGAFAPWISYDLGTVYYALGEPASAMDIWSTAVPTQTGDLAFRLAFNLGVLDYERGAYDSAYHHFRRALEIDPTSVEAKVNLEYAVEKLDTAGSGKSEGDRTAPPGAEVERVLQYLERLEENSWKSTESIDQTAGAPDW